MLMQPDMLIEMEETEQTNRSFERQIFETRKPLWEASPLLDDPPLEWNE